MQIIHTDKDSIYIMTKHQY